MNEEEGTFDINSQDNNTNDDQTVSASKNKSVEQHHAWKQKAYEGMPGARKKTGKDAEEEDKFLPKFVSNHTHYSTTDKDARVSVKPWAKQGSSIIMHKYQ